MTLLEVGRVARAHGIRGEVVVAFTTDRHAERAAVGTELLVGEDHLRVAASRPHKGQYLIRFEGFDDRDRADTLRGRIVRAVAIEDDEAIFVHEVIGLDLVDQYGVGHGRVSAVVDNPASDLMELADGRLVPFVFITEVTDTEVRVDVPEGLLDDSEE